MKNGSLVTLITTFLLTLIVVHTLEVAGAQVMQSPSYQLQSDSINFGGGYSSSTNYQQESTFGEVGTGRSNSTSFNLYAGYQQMQEVYISITGANTVFMSPSIPGVSGGNAFGSTTVNVTTDSVAGYQLTIETPSNPAMVSGVNNINDYNPGAIPEFIFTTAANESHFGYSPEGTDVVQRYLDDGGACDTGSFETSLSCWDGVSTTPVVIAASSDANHPSGATTTVQFQVGIGSLVNQAPGDYIATTTLTAIAL